MSGFQQCRRLHRACETRSLPPASSLFMPSSAPGQASRRNPVDISPCFQLSRVNDALRPTFGSLISFSRRSPTKSTCRRRLRKHPWLLSSLQNVGFLHLWSGILLHQTRHGRRVVRRRTQIWDELVLARLCSHGSSMVDGSTTQRFRGCWRKRWRAGGHERLSTTSPMHDNVGGERTFGTMICVFGEDSPISST